MLLKIIYQIPPLTTHHNVFVLIQNKKISFQPILKIKIFLV